MHNSQAGRVLLKISGEALMGEQESGIDPVILERVAGEIYQVSQTGTQVAMVIGGGNLCRGAGLAAAGMDRVRGDQMGMLATVMNALAMQDRLEKFGAVCRVMTAFPMGAVAETYSAHQGRAALQRGELLICAAGTGNPYFTTDTAASLRAIELQADLMLKATKVDGIYDADPALDAQARRYGRLSFDEALDKRLGVMDLTAMVLCRDNRLPLRVFDMFAEGALYAIVQGEPIGTLLEV